MDRLEISKLFSSYEELSGKEITVCGWIKTLRDSKAIGFMEINDGSSFKSLQVVFESAKVENYKDIVKLNVGAAVRVTGTFILTPQANQPVRAQCFFNRGRGSVNSRLPSPEKAPYARIYENDSASAPESEYLFRGLPRSLDRRLRYS